MSVPVGGRTGQLLCGGGIAASRQCQNWPQECREAIEHYLVAKKTAVTYKCQKRFLRRIGTCKCQNELTGDRKMNIITSESQSQKLARRLFQCAQGAIWVFQLVAEQVSCCVGVELQQACSVRIGRRSAVEL